MSDLDLEYLPSRNVVRFSEYEKKHEKVLENYEQVIEKQTQLAKGKYKTRLDVRYGGKNDNQLMDIFFKDQEAETQIFAFIHGGYWQLFTKATSGSFVEPLVNVGYRVINVDYDLCPKVNLEEQMDQINSFFKWLLKYALETKAPSITIAGHSAEAHLALMALNSDLMKMMGAGIYDLRELYLLESCNPNNVLGLDYQKAIKTSPLLWAIDSQLIKLVNKYKIKMHLLAAEYDTRTFRLQMQQLYDKLKKAHWNTDNMKLDIFKGYDHFDIIENVPVADSDIHKYVMQNCTQNEGL